MAKQIITPFPKEERKYRKDGSRWLKVSELYSRTIQGEGKYIGYPSTFLRLQGCTLDCIWCDTTEVWRTGNKYSVKELLEIMEKEEIVNDLKRGHHLVVTGGSPLLQQKSLIELFSLFEETYKFIPFIEIENEAVLKPSKDILRYVSLWTLSPKLSNSGMPLHRRWRFDVLELYSKLPNTVWKFVISGEQQEIAEVDMLIKALKLNRENVYLMPCGSSQDELKKIRDKVAELAIALNTNFSDRLHITIWNKKVSV